MKDLLKKSFVIVIIFILTIANYGFAIEAIATEGTSVLEKSIFKKKNIEFKAYFDSENEKEKLSNVNEEVTINAELNPKVDGILKEGKLKLNLENSEEANFEIVSVSKQEDISKDLEVKDIKQELTENLKTVTDEEVIDEDKIIEETTKEIANEKENVSSNSEISLTEENYISISNVISNTKFRIVIKYKQGEKINISDLYKKLNLTLEGTFVNADLEESQESESETLKLGWTYSKEIEVISEYNKISPFTVGKTVGTIVQNEITVKREITENNYLPVKETNIEIQVPTLNGKYPTEISVNANRLMATRGETFGAVTFTNDNWSYNEKKHTIEIKVQNEENGTAVNSSGEDNFVVAYRYEDYIDAENIELDKEVTVKVEEYSGKENKIQEKKIEEKEAKDIDAGELITYTVGTTDEAVSKGKINANYYSETAYETEIKTIVSVNILTSDMLEAMKIRGTKEEYIDKTGESYDASGDIKYKGVNFNYSEIQDILKADGTIDLLDKEGNIIYTLDKYNTKSDESTKIELSEYTDNLQIRINKVKSNGTINIEFVKVIGKSNYKAVEFNDFKSIKSTVETSVKYAEQEGTFTLKTMDVEKEFTESFTSAKLYMNKEYLSTVEVNKNVQLKIELNNNKETSDLYKNPYFEIVFPKYVKAVEIQDINLMDEKGLQIKDFHTVEENGTIKIKVELEGTQTEFVGVNLTNGTNIVINANITVDDYTPKKQDQVKLYYYNEAVTNYVMQTKWSVNKNMPSDIIKVTNGFDLAVFEYQAPTGLVPVNEIKNYDGKANNVKSVKQGTIEKQIEIKQETQISQMKLTALNNTGNDCTDVVLLGRIPFKGNKDVVTGADLGTTVTTTLKDKITADGSNTAMATIYYSSNPEADKNLSDENNGWTQEITDISEIKSYLIVVDGTLEAGKVLNYSYDFEIPSELPYESAIYGSFGVYYNNNSDVAVVYESSIADKVGLVTEKGPKLEANLSVDIGDGNDVLEGKRLKYTLKVNNVGDVDMQNVIAKIDVPKYAKNVEQGEISAYNGDYGFVTTDKSKLEYEIGDILAGETKEINFYLKANLLQTLEEYISYFPSSTLVEKDEKGYYTIDEDNNKTYIESVPDQYIETKANIESKNFAKEIETNVVKNKIKKANFITRFSIDYNRNQGIGYETNFQLDLVNNSGSTLKNVKAIFHTSKYLPYVSGECDLENINIEYDEEKQIVTYYLGDIIADKACVLKTLVKSENILTGEQDVDCYFELVADEIETEYSTIIPQKIVKPYLEANQSTSILDNMIKEEEEITVLINVKNIGYRSAVNSKLQLEFSDTLELKNLDYTGDMKGILEKGDGNSNVDAMLPIILSQKEINISCKFITKNKTGTENSIGKIQAKILNENQDEILLEEIKFIVLNDKLTEFEQEKLEEEKIRKEQEKKDTRRKGKSRARKNKKRR